MTGGVRYLDLEDLLGLVRLLRTGPVRDVGLLDSAGQRPRSRAFGEDAYPTLAAKAAALLHSLAGHALVNGNKLIAWLATTVFLDLNGCRCDLDDDEAFTLVMEVAAGELDVGTIAGRLRVVPGKEG